MTHDVFTVLSLYFRVMLYVPLDSQRNFTSKYRHILMVHEVQSQGKLNFEGTSDPIMLYAASLAKNTQKVS